MQKRTYKISYLFLLIFHLFSLQVFSRDSVYWDGKMHYYDTDSLYRAYVHQTPLESFEGLRRFNYILFNILTPPERDREIEKIINLGDELKNDQILLDGQLLKAKFMPVNTPERIEVKEKFIHDLIEKASHQKDYKNLASCYYVYGGFFQEIEQYPEMFTYYGKFLDALENLTEEDYPWKRFGYRMIADVFYKFGDYEKAYYCWKKVLGSSLGYYDESNLAARKGLGLYFQRERDYDRSNYYFYSIIESNDSVNQKDFHEACAYYNLGLNYIQLNNCEKAIEYFEENLTILFDENLSYTNWSLALQVLSKLGECYFETGRIEEAKKTVEIISANAHRSNAENAIYSIYLLKNKYYTYMGEPDSAIAMLESVMFLKDQINNTYNKLPISLARQNFLQAEIEINEQKQQNYRNIIILTFIILIIFGGAIFILLKLYYKKREAYRTLVKKSEEWANTEICEHPITRKEKTKQENQDKADEKDIEIFKHLNKRMREEKLFCDPNLSSESLSNLLGMNRNKISKAINRTTGKNMNQYINEYRVKEVIFLFGEKDSEKLSLEEIMEQAGFSSRAPFFQTFKKLTGISPAEYRKTKMQSVLKEEDA